MRIITINIEDELRDTIDSMVGDFWLFPSRSELVRAAVRDWFGKELQNAPNPPQKVLLPPVKIEPPPSPVSEVVDAKGRVWKIKPQPVPTEVPKFGGFWG